MSVKAEQKERSHETILDSASRLLREKGIAGARVADVMKGAGLTVGGFYAHFGSKEELIDEAIERASRTMRERLFARLDEKPATDRAEVVLKRYLSALHRDETERGCPLPAVIGEAGTRSPEYAGVLAKQVNHMAAALSDQLAPTSAESRAIAPRTLALGLVALMVGGLSLSRALRGTDLSDDVLKACRAVGRIVLRNADA